ncbi:MAG: hypothetical protein Q9201_004274 [Fulgogasparrea decipioides]
MAPKCTSEALKGKHDATTQLTSPTPATTSPQASLDPSTPSVPRRRQRANPVTNATPSSLTQLVSTPSTGSLGRSSTRSGRPYLPEDTGIPSNGSSSKKRSRAATAGSPSESSRRQRFFATTNGSPSTPSRRVSTVLIPTHNHGEATPSKPDLANPISSNKTQNEPRLELDPNGHEIPQQPRPYPRDWKSISSPASKAPEQLMTPTNSTIDNSHLSSRHQKRGARQNAPLAIQEDMDEWVKANWGSGRQTSPPSIEDSEASPRPYAPGGFFEDLYELTIQARAAAKDTTRPS